MTAAMFASAATAATPGLDPATLAGFLAVLARTAALTVSAPVLGDRALPLTIRAVVALALAAAGAAVRGPIDPATLPAVVPVEVMLGLVAGLGARLLVLGVEAGGQVIGLQGSLGLAGQIDPGTGDDALPTRRLLGALVALAFLGAGGLEALARVAAAPGADVRSVGLLAIELPLRAGEVLVLAARVAAPMIIAGTVVSLAVALGSRGAPAVNVFSVDLPLRAAISIAVLLACAPATVGEIARAARRAVASLEVLAP